MDGREFIDIFDGSDEMLIMDGYDDCILGVCSRFGQSLVVAYDYDKVFNLPATRR